MRGLQPLIERFLRGGDPALQRFRQMPKKGVGFRLGGNGGGRWKNHPVNEPDRCDHQRFEKPGDDAGHEAEGEPSFIGRRQ